MSTALTLGKYAPLHRGHELVIRTALAETDHVIAMIYDCPETTAIPLHVRAGWIEDLFPTVEVMRAYGGPTEIGDAPAVTAAHDAYIRTRLGGRRMTHFYSSEFYGEHVSRALGAIDRRVDADRQAIRVSATEVRADPYRCREFVSPRVYRDLVCNIAVVGAPSTGKTTLCETLAKRHATVWTPEYGREYWERHQQDRRLAPEQLVEIARGHLAREEQQLLEANRFLFTDTTPLTTLGFAMRYHGAAPEALARLVERSTSRYQATFLCGDDIPYDDTWDRSGPGSRAALQQWTVAELTARGNPFTVLTRSLEARLAAVAQHLDTLHWLCADPERQGSPEDGQSSAGQGPASTAHQ